MADGPAIELLCMDTVRTCMHPALSLPTIACRAWRWAASTSQMAQVLPPEMELALVRQIFARAAGTGKRVVELSYRRGRV